MIAAPRFPLPGACGAENSLPEGRLRRPKFPSPNPEFPSQTTRKPERLKKLYGMLGWSYHCHHTGKFRRSESRQLSSPRASNHGIPTLLNSKLYAGRCEALRPQMLLPSSSLRVWCRQSADLQMAPRTAIARAIWHTTTTSPPGPRCSAMPMARKIFRWELANFCSRTVINCAKRLFPPVGTRKYEELSK